MGGYEPGQRGSFYDHGTRHKDHESRGIEDRHGLETICTVYRLRDVVFFLVRNDREPGFIILKMLWKSSGEYSFLRRIFLC